MPCFFFFFIQTGEKEETTPKEMQGGWADETAKWKIVYGHLYSRNCLFFIISKKEYWPLIVLWCGNARETFLLTARGFLFISIITPWLYCGQNWTVYRRYLDRESYKYFAQLTFLLHNSIIFQWCWMGGWCWTFICPKLTDRLRMMCNTQTKMLGRVPDDCTLFLLFW